MPFPQLPHVQQGNLATDVSTGIAGLVAGMRDEQERRRMAALQEALLQTRLGAANKPERPFHIIESTPTGPRHALSDTAGNVSPMMEGGNPVAALDPQYFGVNETPEGDLTLTQTPRNARPGTSPVASQVQQPAGQQPRDISPAVMPITDPNTGQTAIAQVDRRKRGTSANIVQQPGGGGPLMPQANRLDVEKAQYASNMARAAAGMERLVAKDSQVPDRVIGRLSTQAILDQLPVVGSSAAEFVRSGMALGLTPAEAQWLSHFYAFVGFAVPEIAGRQMTITEMRQQTSMYIPLTQEPEESRQVKRDNVKFRVQSAIRASGTGWARIIMDPGLKSQVPVEYGGEQVEEPETIQPTTINPRFAPRKRR